MQSKGIGSRNAARREISQLFFRALEFLAFLSFVPEAVITGAAGNFGAVCARMMAAEGAKLALVDLVEDRELVEKLPFSKVFKAFMLLKLVVQHS